MNFNSINIELATLQEDFIIARHFYQLWIDLDLAESYLNLDWQDKTLQYIKY